MSVDILLSLIGILGFLFLIAHGRAEYWKGKFESLNSERPENGGGWREETLFLHVLDRSRKVTVRTVLPILHQSVVHQVLNVYSV